MSKTKKSQSPSFSGASNTNALNPPLQAGLGNAAFLESLPPPEPDTWDTLDAVEKEARQAEGRAAAKATPPARLNGTASGGWATGLGMGGALNAMRALECPEDDAGFGGGGNKVGSSSINQVTSFKAGKNIGRSGTPQGYFKAAGQGNLPNSASDIGIDPADPRMMARSLASTRVSRLLGQDTIAEEVLGNQGGKRGIVSAAATGVGGLALPADVDLSAPESQRTLSNLQVFDYLTGQCDRHMDNILVDPRTGRAKGIDNDAAFGNDNQGLADVGAVPPPCIDKAMAKALTQLKPETYRETLQGLSMDPEHLNDDEIEAAMTRLADLQAYVGRGDKAGKKGPQIVKQWDDQTYARMTDASLARPQVGVEPTKSAKQNRKTLDKTYVRQLEDERKRRAPTA